MWEDKQENSGSFQNQERHEIIYDFGLGDVALKLEQM